MAAKLGWIGNDDEGYVVFDALMAENHRRESEITQYPIETGANVSDHVRPKPIVITLHAIVSQTPIPIDATPISLTRVQDARTKLIKWRDNGTLVDVYTARELYNDLAVAMISEDVDFSNGNDFEADLVMQQVTTASVAFVKAPTPKTNIPKPTTNAGTGTTTANSTSAIKAAWNGL